MFTGIITATPKINAITHAKAGIKLEIVSPYAISDLTLGESIAHNGVCLTVMDLSPNSYWVELSEETLACTTAGSWQEGQCVNVERALRAGDRLGGHIVSGHVDGVGHIASIEQQADYHLVRIHAPRTLLPFIAQKGSITIDGVSLTVNATMDESFELTIIPHTWQETAFSSYQMGTKINIEIDMLARYVARLQEFNT